MSESERETLFRSEARSAARSRYGVPVDPVGVTSWSLTSLLFLVALSVTILICTAKYTRRETVVGTLTPGGGAQQITAIRAGVIAEVFVGEGQSTRTGEPLLRLTYDTNDGKGGSIENSMAASNLEQAVSVAGQGQARAAAIDAQIEAVRSRILGFASQRERLEANRRLQQERARLAAETVEATRQLYQKGLIAALQMRQREDSLISAQQQLGILDGELSSIVSETAQANAEIAQLRYEGVQQAAASRLAAAQIEEKRITLASQSGEVISARIDGIISSSVARVGKTVGPGDMIAVIMPRNTVLEAELWVPSRAVGFLEKGAPVRLMYDAFPFQRFGTATGVIYQVSRSPTLPDDLPTPIETKEPLYRVIVKLNTQDVTAYGKAWPLAPGMQLRADIVLDERSLVSWIFEPLNALRRRA